MALYAVSNNMGGSAQNMAAAYKTLIGLNAPATPRRFEIYDLTLATIGTPADNAMEWDVSRMTAAGTGTSITPNPLDPANAAAVTVATANYTAEPTVTSNSSCLYFGANVRATVRWIAAPGCALVAPATNLNGFVIRGRSAAYASTASASVHFQEM